MISNVLLRGIVDILKILRALRLRPAVRNQVREVIYRCLDNICIAVGHMNLCILQMVPCQPSCVSRDNNPLHCVYSVILQIVVIIVMVTNSRRHFHRQQITDVLYIIALNILLLCTCFISFVILLTSWFTYYVSNLFQIS